MHDYIVIDPAELTERRREVLYLVVDGLTNQQIASKLVLSPYTVKKHVTHLLGIVGVRSRTELVIASYEAGLVPCGRCRHTPGVTSRG